MRWRYDRGGRDTLVAVLLKRSPSPGPELVELKRYDAVGRVSLLQTSSPAGVWYKFHAPTYSLIDELLTYSTVEPQASGGPGQTWALNYLHGYTTDGTRRLVSSDKRQGITPLTQYDWSYDVVGNRVTESRQIASNPDCSGAVHTTSSFRFDNQLSRTTGECNLINRYWSDRAGQRFVRVDSTTSGTQVAGLPGVQTYTALGQLYFSVSRTVQVGTYDYNWHWYDATGVRLITHATIGQQFLPGSAPSPTSGSRTYYVYDGTDVALTLIKSGTTWWVRQRYLVGGLDVVLAGRFAKNLTAESQNLALISDRQAAATAAATAPRIGTAPPRE